MTTYVCKSRGMGTQFFTGASKRGANEWIALKKAQDAGYDITNCDKVNNVRAYGE